MLGSHSQCCFSERELAEPFCFGLRSALKIALAILSGSPCYGAVVVLDDFEDLSAIRTRENHDIRDRFLTTSGFTNVERLMTISSDTGSGQSSAVVESGDLQLRFLDPRTYVTIDYVA